jgi:hypothetical protein
MKTLKYQFIFFQGVQLVPFFQGVQLVPHRREFLFLRGEPVDTLSLMLRMANNAPSNINRRPGVWTAVTDQSFVAVSDPYLSPESHNALPYTHSISVIEYPSGRNIIREIEENTHPDARL